MTTRHALRAALLAAAALGLAGCRSGDGLVKYPVKGAVLVNGRPAERVAVQFISTDPAATGNARRPCGVTGPGGEFELSTNGLNDGAVAGEYAVTFVWLSSNETTATDRFAGRFADERRPAATVRVSGPTALEPFRLEFAERKPPAPPKNADHLN